MHSAGVVIVALASFTITAGFHVSDRTLLTQVSADCKAQCAKFGKIKVPTVGGCEEYKESRPYPQLWQICEDSYKGGFVHGCEVGCSDAQVCFGLTNSDPFLQSRSRACGQYEAMLPRPTMVNACKVGFAKGADARCSDSHHWLTAEYQKREQAVFAERAANEATRLAQIEAQLQSAKRAEAEAAAALERKRQAEIDRQRSKEDEEARRLAEEDEQKKGKTRGMRK